MKANLKANIIPVVMVIIVVVFVIAAVLRIVNLTNAGLINWGY